MATDPITSWVFRFTEIFEKFAVPLNVFSFGRNFSFPYAISVIDDLFSPVPAEVLEYPESLSWCGVVSQTSSDLHPIFGSHACPLSG
jgi:hypothetical protein